MAYDSVNTLWAAEGVKLWAGPPLTEAQARRARVTLAKAMVGQFPGKDRAVRSIVAWSADKSVRRVWLREGITRLVHDLSHRWHGVINPSERPHSANHQSLERFLVRVAIERGLHRLKPPAAKTAKPKPPLTAVRADRARANLKRALTRLKRAQTLAKKYRDQVKYYEKKAAKVA